MSFAVGQIVAAELTTHDSDDGSQVGQLLEHVARPVASFIGDGAYDRDDVYRKVTERHPLSLFRRDRWGRRVPSGRDHANAARSASSVDRRSWPHGLAEDLWL